MNRGSWLTASTELFLGAVDRLADDDLATPSALPGWSRRHVLAHVVSNAAALGRLVRWARTGVPEQMYGSREQRAAEIEAGTQLPAEQLRSAVSTSAHELLTALEHMPSEAWHAEVVTAQGRRVPATEIPWLRTREVAVHATDLAAGVGFADLPAGFCSALVDDVVAWRSGRDGHPALTLSDGQRIWAVAGIGPPATVELPLADLAAWLTRRLVLPKMPALPAWL